MSNFLTELQTSANTLTQYPYLKIIQYSAIIQPWWLGSLERQCHIQLISISNLWFDLDIKGLKFASTTNLKKRPRFAEICWIVYLKSGFTKNFEQCAKLHNAKYQGLKRSKKIRTLVLVIFLPFCQLLSQKSYFYSLEHDRIMLIWLKSLVFSIFNN